GFQQQVRADLDGAQGGGRIGGEERIAGAGGEQGDAALLDVAYGAAADEVLGHVVDGNGAHHARIATVLLDGIGHGQGVHHGGQHAHVVASHAIHAAGGQARAAEDVAAADHHAHFGPRVAHLDDFLGQPTDHLGVDAVVLVTHEGLTGEFEQ